MVEITLIDFFDSKKQPLVDYSMAHHVLSTFSQARFAVNNFGTLGSCSSVCGMGEQKMLLCMNGDQPKTLHLSRYS